MEVYSSYDFFSAFLLQTLPGLVQNWWNCSSTCQYFDFGPLVFGSLFGSVSKGIFVEDALEFVGKEDRLGVCLGFQPFGYVDFSAVDKKQKIIRQ